MVSSELSLAVEDDDLSSNMKEMIGGCCVCSDERGWAENPLVYCDGHGCNVAVHQACYGIVQVPTGPWFCRKCESQERAARVRCELCPHKDGALKRTDNGGWAHVVCALYIPEVQFANVATMEPIVLQSVPHERYNKTCYICEEQGRESKAATGACMTCNKHGCRHAFHVTCAQFAGLLCEEEGSEADNVRYCGYCKYHYSKLNSTSRSFSNSLYCYPHLQKHKERDKHKPKHRRTVEPVLVPSLTVTTEKTYTSTSTGGSPLPVSLKRLEETAARFTNANFQEVSAHPASGKDSSAEVKGAEGKGKKATGHSVAQRGRKPGAGKTSATVTSAAVVTTSTSPLKQASLLGSLGNVKSNPGCSSVQLPQEFGSFADSDLRNDTYSHSQQIHARGLSKGGDATTPEGLNAFSSLMTLQSAVTSASVANKAYESSHAEYSGLTSASYKRPTASTGSMDEDSGVKEKKRRGNKRNKYGPGRPRGNKAQETAPLLSASSASPASSVASASSSLTGVSTGGSNTQKSPPPLRNGSVQNLNVASPPAALGAFQATDAPATLPSTILGSNTAALPVSQIPQPSASHVHQAVPSLAPPTTTQANALPGATFNFTPSHTFGNHLNPNPAVTPLISQSDNNPADQEVQDSSRSLAVRSSSPRGTLSPRSPASGLQVRYDQSSSGSLEHLPPVATSIEQLLERQWSEGQQFLLEHSTTGDILGMLKSLYQLQVENRRLEEQIKALTARKEQLQLLRAQLSLPFASNTPSSTLSPQLHAFSSQNDVMNSSKSPHLPCSYLPDSSLPTTVQDACSSAQSTTSSSVSTPPPVGQSPPQQNSTGVAGVPQVNGMAVGALANSLQPVPSSIPSLPGVGGLMGTIPGNQLAINGIVGALNGVIQTPATMGLPAALTNSTSGLALLSDQQRQILLQQQQLQQFLASQPAPQDQHQALLYQLMQQQHHQHHQHELQQLQLSAAAQLPINSLLTSGQAPGQHTLGNNPFLAIHGDPSAQKVARLSDKSGSSTQDKS
ncbi:protein AF-10 isoform X3 [Erpetoichthys calabaricus]|uniref:protein AF-10 isoform X3 n=1 Tax=Erpetoichthys calabaricus TaxID=27687 RepID=UPI002234BF1D|nr:protein AF-10 isoform X3 [Erpetoichthys calabaricus]